MRSRSGVKIGLRDSSPAMQDTPRLRTDLALRRQGLATSRVSGEIESMEGHGDLPDVRREGADIPRRRCQVLYRPLRRIIRVTPEQFRPCLDADVDLVRRH